MFKKIKEKLEGDNSLLAVILIAVAVVSFAGGYAARQIKVMSLKEKLTEKSLQLMQIMQQSATEFSDVEEGGGYVEDESRAEIIKMSAADVFDMLAADDESTGKTAYLDGIFREQLEHFERSFQEFQIFFAREK